MQKSDQKRNNLKPTILKLKTYSNIVPKSLSLQILLALTLTGQRSSKLVKAQLQFAVPNIRFKKFFIIASPRFLNKIIFESHLLSNFNNYLDIS